MSGLPDHNFPLFYAVEARLLESGHQCVNPAAIGQTLGLDKPRWTYLRRDLQELLTCDAIILLPNWEYSQGAFTEFMIARELSMPIYYWSRIE